MGSGVNPNGDIVPNFYIEQQIGGHILYLIGKNSAKL